MSIGQMLWQGCRLMGYGPGSSSSYNKELREMHLHPGWGKGHPGDRIVQYVLRVIFRRIFFLSQCAWTNENKVEYSFGTEQKRRASGVLLHRKEGGKNWQQPLLKMDLCKKLQSYLNTIFLGMASLLTSFVFFYALRAVFFSVKGAWTCVR